MAPISVLIADAQPLFAEVLAQALKRRPLLAIRPERPTDGYQATVAVAALAPDVALLDYWLPHVDGPAATKAILERRPKTKILVLSRPHRLDHVARAVAAGAAGFLPKWLPLPRIEEAIVRAHSGDAPLFAQAVGWGGAHPLMGRNGRALYAKLTTLTPRELQVLACLDRGVDPDAVADRLGLRPRVVRGHIEVIARKTGHSAGARPHH